MSKHQFTLADFDEALTFPLAIARGADGFTYRLLLVWTPTAVTYRLDQGSLVYATPPTFQTGLDMVNDLVSNGPT